MDHHQKKYSGFTHLEEISETKRQSYFFSWVTLPFPLPQFRIG
jgi:hypothetical protein